MGSRTKAISNSFLILCRGISLGCTTPTAKNNFSLIPYFKTSVAKEYTNAAGQKITQASLVGKDAGLDAKISLSSSLNLDLTLHPDFSQVEVDRQVTNLSRFELFFLKEDNSF